MDMYSLVSIIGGLAFFLFGMNIMSSGLKKVAGEGVLKAIGLLSSYDTAGKEEVRKCGVTERNVILLSITILQF